MLIHVLFIVCVCVFVFVCVYNTLMVVTMQQRTLYRKVYFIHDDVLVVSSVWCNISVMVL